MGPSALEHDGIAFPAVDQEEITTDVALAVRAPRALQGMVFPLGAERRRAFEGLAHTAHHYAETRALTDRVPESTLRLTPEQAAAVYPSGWKALTGA